MQIWPFALLPNIHAKFGLETVSRLAFRVRADGLSPDHRLLFVIAVPFYMFSIIGVACVMHTNGSGGCVLCPSMRSDNMAREGYIWSQVRFRGHAGLEIASNIKLSPAKKDNK